MTAEIKSKLRVLFIITQSEFGGAQRFLFNFIGSLDKDQYDVSVATGATGDRSLTKALNESYGISPYSLDRLHRDGTLWQDFLALIEMRSFIKRQKPDTVFLLSSKAGFIGSLAARLIKPQPKVVYRIGGWSFNDPVPKFQRFSRRYLEYLSSRWKDIIIVNNKNDYDQAIDYKIRPRKELVLVYNGLNPYQQDILPREEARLKLIEIMSSKSGEAVQPKFIVGTIANLYPAKGIPILIETAKSFRKDSNFVFCVIGDGPERKNLENRIADAQLENEFFLMGQIPNALELISGFDIFVLPSIKEGFPWSLLEAMTAKIPVIASNVGAVNEIIQNGINGFIVDPGQSEPIAEAIDKIINSVDQGQSLGIEAHQTVLHKFNDISMNHKVQALL